MSTNNSSSPSCSPPTFLSSPSTSTSLLNTTSLVPVTTATSDPIIYKALPPSISNSLSPHDPASANITPTIASLAAPLFSATSSCYFFHTPILSSLPIQALWFSTSSTSDHPSPSFPSTSHYFPVSPFHFNHPSLASTAFSFSNTELPLTYPSAAFSISNITQNCSMKNSFTPPIYSFIWEEKKTLVYQYDVNDHISVCRRSDNDFINGTKLLNVTYMTRGKRDSILKNEKSRDVIKSGPMRLKGVWIPIDRAIDLAYSFKIYDKVAPIFKPDLSMDVVAYQPKLGKDSPSPSLPFPSDLSSSTADGYAPSHSNLLATPSHSPFCLESTTVSSYMGSYPTHDAEDPSNSSLYSTDMNSPSFPTSSAVSGRFPLSPTSTRKNSPNVVPIPCMDYSPTSPSAFMDIPSYTSHSLNYITPSLDTESYSRVMHPPPPISLQNDEHLNFLSDSVEYISPVSSSFPVSDSHSFHSPSMVPSSSTSSTFSSFHNPPPIPASYLREKLNSFQPCSSSSATTTTSSSSTFSSTADSSSMPTVTSSSSVSPSKEQRSCSTIPTHLRHHSAPTLSALLTALSSSFDCMDPLMDRLQKKEHANDSLRLYLPSFISAAEELEVQAKRNADLLQTVLMHRRVSSSRT